MQEHAIIQQALHLATHLQQHSSATLSATEKAFHHKMHALLQHPLHKVMLIELLDRSFRCKDARASFDLIAHILQKYGIADFFTLYERCLLKGFLLCGGLMPFISVPLFIWHLRKSTKDLVLDWEALKSHSSKRSAQNIRLNINIIGEEVLGEQEARARIEGYKNALKSRHITYISIKITTILSHITSIAFDYAKTQLVERLDTLYELALKEQERQGQEKFINLDMEEFKDLELTVTAFMESVSKFPIHAGIVLQAYIPNSFAYLQALTHFSKQRVLEGKPPIKIRFVKGANMEHEATIASQKGWVLPTFSQKVDTDSHYKKMLDFVLEDDNFRYVHIGIASHNMFEIAYAYTRIYQANAQQAFSFEMLEGMSMQCAFELARLHGVILYAPVCDRAHFHNAIAYLVRRLDENTSSPNFLRDFFALDVDSRQWHTQKELFLRSIEGKDSIDSSPIRAQERVNITHISSFTSHVFCNESDTDFSLATNRTWAKNIISTYEHLAPMDIYPVASTHDFTKEHLASLDIYEKIHNRLIGRAFLAGASQLKHILHIASNSSFAATSFYDIYAIFAQVARLFKMRRGELIGIAALETGKTFVELDAEVSEAIDFVEFYPHALRHLQESYTDARYTPHGIGVVIAPWNFPIGISAGTIAAPLAAGNVIIYKPSSLSMLTGYAVCKCFWDAGIPRDALIFCPSSGSDLSRYVLSSAHIAFAILTGGEDTAQAILQANPTLLLSAETGGKNATIVSKFADRESAIKNIIHSAFSNSGQKCSSTSLLVLEAEVYEDEAFKQALIDAASSLHVGSPFVLHNQLGALCDAPSSKLKHALEHIERHEYWALRPSFINDNPHLMSPCIKYGTKKGDFTHTTELFAPILSVMKADNLAHAIEIVNATGYGLTAGLESLDEREWEYFSTHIEAGNVYINKPTTGAIVLRQPFGGVKKSAIGFGRKVGFYNYMTQFLHIHTSGDVAQQESPLIAHIHALKPYLDAITFNNISLMAHSYTHHYIHEFCARKDYVNIRGEENIFSYKPICNLCFRICLDDSLQDALGVIIAAAITHIPLTISHDDSYDITMLAMLCSHAKLHVHFVAESLESCANAISTYERTRYHATPCASDALYLAAARDSKMLIREKPLLHGYFELLFYHNEQSLSIAYHRYGNLGHRGINNSHT